MQPGPNDLKSPERQSGRLRGLPADTAMELPTRTNSKKPPSKRGTSKKAQSRVETGTDETGSGAGDKDNKASPSRASSSLESSTNNRPHRRRRRRRSMNISARANQFLDLDAHFTSDEIDAFTSDADADSGSDLGGFIVSDDCYD